MLLAIVCAPAVNASPVTVTVATSSGDPALDTIVIFDPLDAAAPSSQQLAPRMKAPRALTAAQGAAVADKARPIHATGCQLEAGSPK